MKKWQICLAALMLAGCGTPKSFETMSDQYVIPQQPEAAQVSIWLPEEAAVLTMENADTGSQYLCDGYAVAVQTMAAGDLDSTLRSITGYGADALQIYALQSGECKRYECVWACAGEGGDQVGKAVILDDGTYHYTVTVLAPAANAGAQAEVWQQILGSVALKQR